MTSITLSTPLSESKVRSLKIGDTIDLDGQIVLARDRAHQRLFELAMLGGPAPFELDRSAIYHCGPLAREIRGEWQILSAGPTTSARMERFEPQIVRTYRVRMIIGKGGMGSNTTEAMKEVGSVYCAAAGGAGALLAKSVKKVKGVEWKEFGIAEAVWLLEVEKMGPLVVAIDAHGNNLYDAVSRKAEGLLGLHSTRS